MCFVNGVPLWSLFSQFFCFKLPWNNARPKWIRKLWEVWLSTIASLLKRTMYQRKVDVDMLNAGKSVLADLLSVSPSSAKNKGLTVETSANTLFMAFSISTSTLCWYIVCSTNIVVVKNTLWHHIMVFLVFSVVGWHNVLYNLSFPSSIEYCEEKRESLFFTVLPWILLPLYLKEYF